MRFLLATILVTACQLTPVANAPQKVSQFSWLAGCWQSSDGNLREVWSTSEGGYHFGYAVTYKSGEPIFYEMMRILPTDPPVMSAYPRGVGPSDFPMLEQADQSVTFANAEHDYPQRIYCSRAGDTLSATISRMDGSQQTDFTYLACPKG